MPDKQEEIKTFDDDDAVDSSEQQIEQRVSLRQREKPISH